MTVGPVPLLITASGKDKGHLTRSDFVIVDAQGVTRRSFLGPMTATDLWAALAELRDPESAPGGCDHHGT